MWGDTQVGIPLHCNFRLASESWRPFRLALARKRTPPLTHDPLVGHGKVNAQRIVPPNAYSCWQLTISRFNWKRFGLALESKRALPLSAERSARQGLVLQEDWLLSPRGRCPRAAEGHM